MRTNSLSHMLTLTMLLCAPVWASGGEEQRILDGMLSRLEPWLGTWQIEATWAGGGTVWSQVEYRPMLDGAFIEAVSYVSDNGGEVYQRYHSVMAAGDWANQVIAHTFNNRGAYEQTVLSIEGDGIGLVSTTAWGMDGTQIKERLELTSRDTMHWQVWMRNGNAADDAPDWAQIMDGTWHRVEAAPVELDPPTGLDSSLAMLTPLLGGWEAAVPSADDSVSWVRNEASVGLAGTVLELRSWEMSGNRYRQSITFLYNPTGSDMKASITLTEDGSVIPATVSLSETPGQPQVERTIAAGLLGERQLRQTVRLLDAGSYRVEIAARAVDSEPWQTLQVSTWYRQGPAAGVHVYPIEHRRFVAAGSEQRSFVKEVEVAAGVEPVYAVWTTSEGWSRVYPPPSRARIELAVGGRYEWLFDGTIGGNGCQVLSFLPNRMVSFSWNAPPSQPETRLARTWVVVELEPIALDRTRVRLSHLGFGQGAEWDETLAYFEQAWDRVLARLQDVLGEAAG